jgi:hypothetical protein
VVRLCTRTVRALGLVVTFIVTLALAPQIVGANISAKGHVAKALVTIRISLDQTHVAAGTPIKGTAVLTNNGSKTMPVQQCATDGWLAVGLANKAIPYSPGFALVACPPSVVLLPGPNRFPVKVSTTYGSCLQPGGQSVIFIPKCVPNTVSANPLPPLPAGRYVTKVVTMGLPSNTAISKSVVVTLRTSTFTTQRSAATGANPVSSPPCAASSLAVHGGRQGGGFVGNDSQGHLDPAVPDELKDVGKRQTAHIAWSLVEVADHFFVTIRRSAGTPDRA